MVSGNTRKGILAAVLLLLGCSSMPPGNSAGIQNNQSNRKNLELISASRKGDKDRVISLIKDGADINAQDPEGWTPYLAASAEGKWEIMHILQGLGCKTDPGF